MSEDESTAENKPAEENQQPESLLVKDDQTNEPKPKKKKRRGLKIFLLVLAVIFILPTLYLGWLGFIPGLSSIMGAHSPRDLGVTYTQADTDSFYNKTGSTELNFANAPAHPTKKGKKSVFTGSIPVSQSLSQEEITARFNLSGWSNSPFTDVQIRFSEGRIETSGKLIAERIPSFISLVGGVEISQQDIEEAVPWLERFLSTSALYIDANVSVKNNKLNMNVNSAQIGRYNIPNDFANDIFTNLTSSTLEGIPGLDISSVTIGDGTLNFDGMSPENVYVQ